MLDFLLLMALSQAPVVTSPEAQALNQAVAPVAGALTAPPTGAQVRADAADPVGSLVGISEAGVRDRLGEPAVARREGAGALWTYRLPACSVLVFFREQAGQGLRVSGVEAADGGGSAERCLAAAPAASGA